MPELPDIDVYVDALRRRLVDQPLDDVSLQTPFLLRTVEPPLSGLIGKHVRSVRRLGKRIVIAFEADLALVMHLMIAGRLQWKPSGAKDVEGRTPTEGAKRRREERPKVSGRGALAVFQFPTGKLVLTEAGTTRRASLHLVHGEADLRQFERGGLEVFETTLERFAERLRSENHTVKRALTDPRLFSGIGNAYSDEILHRARMSPVKLTSRVTDAEVATLFTATRDVLAEWTQRLREQTGDGFPEKVTAFRPEMAVHGKYKQPCPVCGAPVQRIRYADNETNYCARCQNEGRLLADRSLSRLLKQDWPRTLDD